MNNAITRESRKYLTLLLILLFSLILEIWLLLLVVLKHELVVKEPTHKIILMCLIFIGTFWSLSSLISTRRKTIVKMEIKSNEIETTSIGLFPVIKRYLEVDLNIEKLPTKPNGSKSYVKINDSNGETLFYYYSDYFDKSKLIHSKSKFLNELGKI